MDPAFCRPRDSRNSSLTWFSLPTNHNYEFRPALARSLLIGNLATCNLAADGQCSGNFPGQRTKTRHFISRSDKFILRAGAYPLSIWAVKYRAPLMHLVCYGFYTPWSSTLFSSIYCIILPYLLADDYKRQMWGGDTDIFHCPFLSPLYVCARLMHALYLRENMRLSCSHSPIMALVNYIHIKPLSPGVVI